MKPSVLYLLNVSNPDRISADSGYLFADILAPPLLDRGVEITVASPVALSDPRARHAMVAPPASKYRARFDADIATNAALLRRVVPSVVIANQVEAAPAMRAAMLEADSEALLACYCHYLPFHLDANQQVRMDPSLGDAGLAWPVLLHFFAGIAACDRVLVHSDTAYGWIITVAQQIGLDLVGRVRIVPPPRDPRLVRTPGTRRSFLPQPGAPMAIYNHRLYAHYGTGAFVDLAKVLLGEVPLRLQVMDLFGTRAAGRSRLDDSPERHLAALAAIGGDRW